MKLSIKECLSFGWNTFKQRPWLFVKAALIVIGVSVAFNILSGLLSLALDATSAPWLVLVLALLSLALTIAAVYVSIVLDNMGVTKFYLNAHDNVASASVRTLWTPHPFVKYVLTAILLGVMAFVGFILLVVPGIIVVLVFGMSVYLVMDRGLGPIEALKESARITRGNRWHLFLLGLAIVVINLIGALLLLVGLFVSVPVSILASVHAYRTLSKPAVPVM